MDVSDLNEISGKVKNWQKEETRYFLSLPRKNFIFAIVAFLGLCTTFLPWADVIVGFYAQALAVGLHFFFGWLVFLVFISVIGVLLFNKYVKLPEPVAVKIPIWGALAAVLLSIGFITGHLFNVQYGSYLCLAISVIFLLVVLFYDKIFPDKRTL
jgi:hypothetical protein